jgi:hypothetical protein
MLAKYRLKFSLKKLTIGLVGGCIPSIPNGVSAPGIYNANWLVT